MKSLIAGGYVEELNLDNIPNSSNINDTYWVSKGYCVPYLMNYIYVVYDSETCPVEIHSYNDLLQSGLKISTIDGARNRFESHLLPLVMILTPQMRVKSQKLTSGCRSSMKTLLPTVMQNRT